MLYTQVDVPALRRRDYSQQADYPMIPHTNLRVSSQEPSSKASERFNGQKSYAINHEARQTAHNQRHAINRRVQFAAAPVPNTRSISANKKHEFEPRYGNQGNYRQKMTTSQIDYLFTSLDRGSSGAAASHAARYPPPYHDREFNKVMPKKANNISEYLVNRRQKKSINDEDVKLHFSLGQLEEKRKVDYHRKYPSMVKPQEISIRRFWHNFGQSDACMYQADGRSTNDRHDIDNRVDDSELIDQYARPAKIEEPDYGIFTAEDIGLADDDKNDEITQDGINLKDFEEIVVSHPYKLDHFMVSEAIDIFEPCLYGKVRSTAALIYLFRKLCSRLASQGIEKGHPLADCILHRVMLDTK